MASSAPTANSARVMPPIILDPAHEPSPRAAAAERLLPRAGGAGAGALARAGRVPGHAAQPRGRPALRVLRGPADRERLPGRAPRAGPRLQGRLPALQDDDRA